MAFPPSGRVQQIGASSKAMPLKKVSTDAGRDVHFSGDSRKLHWTHGSWVHSISVQKALRKNKPKKGQKSKPLKPWKKNLSWQQESDRPADGLGAIVGARIVTMKGDEVLEKGTVLWKGNRIVEVGSVDTIKLPKGTKVFDGNGKTVIPGLIDVHFHGGQGSGKRP